MKKLKLYEANDKMIDLIDDNYAMLQELSAFGIRLGFGDKTVHQVCEEQGEAVRKRLNEPHCII